MKELYYRFTNFPAHFFTNNFLTLTDNFQHQRKFQIKDINHSQYYDNSDKVFRKKKN